MSCGEGRFVYDLLFSLPIILQLEHHFLTFLPLHSKSTEIAHQHRRERPEVSDIKVIIRKDTPKLNRVRYLLEMKQEIRKATSVVEEEANIDPAVNNV